MERKKRSFFIIGNNPNTIEEAQEFLNNGANALEPDIVYADGQFYVSHTPQLSYKAVITLTEYLAKLKALLLAHQYNLALIIWDIKTTNFDPNQFVDIIKENFSGRPFDGIAMLVTNADDHTFLNQFKSRYDNVGIGLDESDLLPSEIENIFKDAGQKNFAYADGITTLLNKTGVYKNVTEAIHCRNENKPVTFGIVYTWVLRNKSSFQKYLDIYIDGIMVDIGSTGKLKDLISSAPYCDVYEVAQNGYNPFVAVPIPSYKLSVKTKDEFLAGTDAQFLFTLTGTNGRSLQSLPYDGNRPGILESGTTSYLVLEGVDLGEIKSLSVEVLTGGVGDGWLPESIIVESKSLKEPVSFIFNNEDKQEWITHNNEQVTKLPDVPPTFE